jgi:hypothetical protein
VLVGVAVLLLTIGATYLQAARNSRAIRTLTELDRMRATRPVSDAALADARYHAAHARDEQAGRWGIGGYATVAALGTAIAMLLVVSGLPRRAASR